MGFSMSYTLLILVILGGFAVGSLAVGSFFVPRLLKQFVGEILVMKDPANGRRYRVLKQPNEAEKDAIARLRAKMLKARQA
jgi:hypothetical protein